MRVRRGGTCRCIFLRAEHFAQFVGGTFPVSRRLRFKCAGHRTPARILHENGFLFWRGRPVFALDSLQRADCGEIRLSLFS